MKDRSHVTKIGRPIVMIPLSVRRRMIAHAKAVYPEEACGILWQCTKTDLVSGSDPYRICDYLPMQNIAPPRQRRRCYQVDPAMLLKAQRDGRKKHWIIAGIFHSHPDHPAAPSQRDLRQAWPEYCYLIASVQHGVAGKLTAWRFVENLKRFEKLRCRSAADRPDRRKRFSTCKVTEPQ